MGLIDITLGNIKVPAYDIATVTLGFYIGYAEGKGIDVSPAKEYLTKYGPTVFTAAFSYATITPLSRFTRFILNKSQDPTKRDLVIKLEDDKSVEYSKLSDNQKEQIDPSLLQATKSLEQFLDNISTRHPVARMTARTAVLTAVSYYAGRTYSTTF